MQQIELRMCFAPKAFLQAAARLTYACSKLQKCLTRKEFRLPQHLVHVKLASAVHRLENVEAFLKPLPFEAQLVLDVALVCCAALLVGLSPEAVATPEENAAL